MSILEEFNQIVDDRITRYLESLNGESPEPARSMEAEAEDRGFPIVGPLVGRFLKMMAGLIEPECIVELGSGFGYSAYWFGSGCESSTIHLTDYEAENLESAKEYLSRASLVDRCHFHEGDALESARTITDPVDLVFLDIDKKEYPDALSWAGEALEPGGWLIADNVLREGKVVESNPEDPEVQAIRDVNRELFTDRWETSILPLRDGLALARLTEDR